MVGQPGDTPVQNYAHSVIEYATPAQLPAARTLARLFRSVTLRPDASLTSGAITLILGSSFTALKTAGSNSSGSGPSLQKLAGAAGGISAATNICKDSNAFSGPG